MRASDPVESGRLCLHGFEVAYELFGPPDAPVVLLIHGGDDRRAPIDLSQRLVEMGGCGHGVMARDPVRTNLLISNFLGSASYGAPGFDADARHERQDTDACA